ncbi:hypothetical protein HJC23_013144 [Cyclotella cryptica]|uniref:Uncharacterized protein n=1 Tax=Cyclotella cryptica TaxID=29204 RepID=A0ABD3QML5_9STRA
MNLPNFVQRITSISLVVIHLISQVFAFRTASHSLPLKIRPIPKNEIMQRLGISSCSYADTSHSSKNKYNIQNEHEVLCPVTGSHQGILCTTRSWCTDFRDAESIANSHDLVSQVISSGSLAASIRNRGMNRDSLYYLPFVITLVESCMADEVSSMLFDEIMLQDPGVKLGSLVGENVDMVFNSDGLETNEILLDLSDDRHDLMLYACNTHMDRQSATSDVYLIPTASRSKIFNLEKVWRFTIDYKVATVNLSQIQSFGKGESTMPLRPDVWLKDDYY